MPDAHARRPINILLVAEEAAGIQALRAITGTAHRVVGVVTSEHRAGHAAASVRRAAEQLGCRIWPSCVVKDPAFAETMRSARIDVLLNVHSLHLIHPVIVAAPAIGSFNLHPGPLPQYAGLNSPSWAIYNGESQHAATVHWLAPDIDMGPIAFHAQIATEKRDTGLSLSAKCVKAGIPLLLRLLDAAAHDPAAIPRVPQDLGRRRYYGKEVPENGRLRWSQPARSIVRFVRACDYFPWRSPWGHPRARLNGEPLRILKAFCTARLCMALTGTVGDVAEAVAFIAAADAWVGVSRVEINGRVLNASEVLTPGLRLEDGD